VAPRHLASSLRPLTPERPPARVGDVHPGHFDRLAASTHALALHGCEAGSNNVDQQLDCKTVRQQECLCAALSGAAGEHFEGGRPSLVSWGRAGGRIRVSGKSDCWRGGAHRCHSEIAILRLAWLS
jgi:hypothetical protein